MRDSHILLRWGWYRIPTRTNFPIIVVISKNEAVEVLKAEIKGAEIKAIEQKPITGISYPSKNDFLRSFKREKAVIGVPDKFYTPTR